MIRFRDCLKSVGTTIVCFCAAFLAFLFQGFRLDLNKLDTTNFNEYQNAFYKAQVSQSNVMLAVSGGILLVFAIITLAFSISRFIHDNEGNMGILKAFGYSRFQIAINFVKYGINSLIGCISGFIFSIFFNPIFYGEMNSDPNFPKVEMSFHLGLTLLIIIAPAVLFGLMSFIIAYIKLRKTPLDMIKRINKNKTKRCSEKKTFLKTLKSTILYSHISLILFVGFAALCFGATVQMSFSMEQLGTSPLFFWMMFLIGLLLGISILYLAFSFTYQGNKEYMTLLKAYGYNEKECISVLYGGYIIVTIIGFISGTIYQFILIKFMVKLFSEASELVFEYSWIGLLYTLLIFIPTYIIIEVIFFIKMKKKSIKEVFIEI